MGRKALGRNTETGEEFEIDLDTGTSRDVPRGTMEADADAKRNNGITVKGMQQGQN
jgi:hypothetical protein